MNRTETRYLPSYTDGNFIQWLDDIAFLVSCLLNVEAVDNARDGDPDGRKCHVAPRAYSERRAVVISW